MAMSRNAPGRWKLVGAPGGWGFPGGISSECPEKVETFVGEMSKTPLTPNLVRLSLLDFLFCVLIADLTFDFWYFVLFYHKTSGPSGSNNELSITET